MKAVLVLIIQEKINRYPAVILFFLLIFYFVFIYLLFFKLYLMIYKNCRISIAQIVIVFG